MQWIHTIGGTFLTLLMSMICLEIAHGLHLEVINRSYKQDKTNRQKREWVIPPSTIIEGQDNSYRNPIAKIQSDHHLEKRITYSIKGMGVDKGIFIINQRTGELNVTAIVDREETPVFFLKGYALDQDLNNVEPPIDLRVKVIDINDNDPVFTQEIFHGTIEELSASNTFVIKLNATDADDPNTVNAKLAFKILSQEPGDLPMFIINKDTGEVLSIVSNIDREKQSIYNLVVEVKDNDGKDGALSSTSILRIKVKDVNDNIPYLEKEQYEGSIEENTANVEVLRMKAIDLDEEYTDNWLANFTIVSGNENGIFEIVTDATTNEGILMVVKEVDYEMMQQVELGVVVSNRAEYHKSVFSAGGGGASVSGGGGGGGGGGVKKIPIKVNVRNIPEGPVFKPNRKNLNISEGKNIVNKIIGSYKAYDGDTGKVAENVKYAKEYDPDNWFTIDSTTSEIKLLKKPDRESIYVVNGAYVAKILAISEDLPGKTATGTIAIQVEDENDNCPTLVEPIQTVCYNAKFINVTAVDRDDFPNGSPFKFTILDEPEGHAQFWKLGANNGTSVQLLPQNIWPGSHKVHIEVKDNQGVSCPEKQILSLFICTCAEGAGCIERQTNNTVGLGAGAIGLMILACLILLLVPLLLLLCYCGSAGKGFMAIPNGTEATFVQWNKEGAKDMAILPQPVHSIGGNVSGAGMTKVEVSGLQSMDRRFTSHVVERRREEEIGLLTSAGMAGGMAVGMAAGTVSGNTIKSIGMMGSGNASAGFQGGFGGAVITGASLDEDFIKDYFIVKAFTYADEDEAQPAKDCLLVYSQEEVGSLSGSIGCCSFIESDFDDNFLDDLGLKFKALADICQGVQLNNDLQSDRYTLNEELCEIAKTYKQDSGASVNISVAAPSQNIANVENTYSSTETHFHRKEPDMLVREEFIADDSTRYIHKPVPRGNVIVTEQSYTTGPTYILEPVPQQNVLVTERVIGNSSSLHNLLDIKDRQNVMVTERVITSDKGLQGLVGAGELPDSQYVLVTERLLAPASGVNPSLSIPDLAVGQNVLVTERHYTPISGIQGNVRIPAELSGVHSVMTENIAMKEGGIQGHFVNNDQLLVDDIPTSSNNVSKSTSRVTKYSNVQYTRS
ncbi:hypothetical protein GDO86_011051 [Hymenochirus boettgeri]|uniref:Cadherin domain-containing protein n=1 Tax=Hymenochirus boettgeri TaxID=247094 RepID=A0A8T2JA39_9PIPI|nr:hypothetical protein GDO86_011051 [Hymenochirus boettgeri]